MAGSGVDLSTVSIAPSSVNPGFGGQAFIEALFGEESAVQPLQVVLVAESGDIVSTAGLEAATTVVETLQSVEIDGARERVPYGDIVQARTVFVDTAGVAITNFNLKKADKDRLYDNGRVTVQPLGEAEREHRRRHRQRRRLRRRRQSRPAQR